MEKIEGETCPTCMKKKLTLIEDDTEVPFFGKVYVFGMECGGCDFRKFDVEAAEPKEPAKYTLEVSGKDLSVRIVKSSGALIKFPKLKIMIEPGISSEGFVSNVERLLNNVQEVLEMQKEGEEDNAKKKKLRKLIDAVLDVKEGKATTTLVIEDKTGNSAIISEKAKKEKLKK